jgi:hypothetical protein
MIRLIIRLPLVLAIALPLAWAGTLFLTGDPDAIMVQGIAGLAQAYPEEEVRGRLVAEAIRAVSLYEPRLPRLGGDRSRQVHAGLLASAFHLEAVLRILPVTLILALAGVSAGLVFRERMRDLEGYASPTAAGLATGAVGAGALWMTLFALSPIPVSYGWLYLASAALSLGGSLYVANLPLKL